MKVLQIVKTSEGAMWAFRQIKVLTKLGVEVRVILPSLDGKLPKQLREIGVTLYECDMNTKNPLKLLKANMKLHKIVNSFNPDIIHSHFVLTTYLIRLGLRNDKTPRAFQVPGPLHLESGPYGMIDKILSQKNDHWIASCKWTQDKYCEMGIDPTRVHLSFYGTDTSEFAIGENKSTVIREELNIQENTPLIGMVAYLYPPKNYLGQKVGLKGHEDFIEAVSILKKEIPNIKALIVGKEWGGGTGYENHIKRIAKETCGDSIIFMGFRTDIPEIYRNLDVAVHPSLSENLGGAVESMLIGVPTITTNIGGFTDIVKNNETGWLVNPQKPIELAEKLRWVLMNKDESRKIALNGHEYVKFELDVNKTGKQVYDIYSRILANRHGIK